MVSTDFRFYRYFFDIGLCALHRRMRTTPSWEETYSRYQVQCQASDVPSWYPRLIHDVLLFAFLKPVLQLSRTCYAVYASVWVVLLVTYSLSLSFASVVPLRPRLRPYASILFCFASLLPCIDVHERKIILISM